MGINEAIDQAIALHQAGDLGAAEKAYRHILVAAPALADIHYLLGMACLSQGRPDATAKALRAALRLKDGQGEWWYVLGQALRQTGDRPGAIQALSNALARLQGALARQADVLAEWGALLASSGDEGAESKLRQALALVPGLPSASGNLAALLFNRFIDDARLNDPDAVASLREATDLAPNNLTIRLRHGLALLRAERPAEALAIIDQVLAREPGHATALLARSDALSTLGRYEEAAEVAERAARQAPGLAPPLVALGVAWHGMGALDDALKVLRAAVQADPGNLPAQLNLGTLLRDLGDDDGAEQCYQRSLILAPSLPVVHWQRAQARLMAGDLAEGWREYEWRWGMPGFTVPLSLRHIPVWDGDPLPAGAVLLIHAEQGHGDSLQFVRYLPLLRDRGLALILQVQPALVRLFRESLPSDIMVEPLGGPPPDTVQCRCPLLGLPLRMGTVDLTAVPSHIPYLQVPEDRRALWQDRLQGLSGLKVGLVWAGDGRAGDARAAAVDRRRSVSLSQLTLLGTVPGVSYVSLQKGPKAVSPRDAPFPIHDWTAELADFADTAALVSALDLVIGVDTAVVHLSGALARPTWVLSRFDGCWRWLRHRPDNPWYPGLRLFRQTRWGNWRPVIADLVNALAVRSSERVGEVK